MSTSRRCRSAFTLVELLIVIAIIALLIAILLPTLSAARRQAKVVACASNLHQLSIAFRSYVETYDGKLPRRLGHWPTLFRPFWDKRLKGNSGDWVINDGVIRCPEAIDKTTGPAVTAGGAFEPWYAQASTIGYMLSSYGMIGEQGSGDIAAFDLKKANMMPIFFDCTAEYVSPQPANTYTTGGMSGIATRRHLRVANVAYIDGSVQTYRLPELWGLKWTSTWVAPTPLPRVPW